MTEARISTATDRIERALARIEVAGSPPPQAVSAATPTRGLAELEARHAALRASTKDALSALEGLITTAGAQS
jgi:hypothetical protein